MPHDSAEPGALQAWFWRLATDMLRGGGSQVRIRGAATRHCLEILCASYRCMPPTCSTQASMHLCGMHLCACHACGTTQPSLWAPPCAALFRVPAPVMHSRSSKGACPSVWQADAAAEAAAGLLPRGGGVGRRGSTASGL